jgi:hypothetical protein
MAPTLRFVVSLIEITNMDSLTANTPEQLECAYKLNVNLFIQSVA